MNDARQTELPARSDEDSKGEATDDKDRDRSPIRPGADGKKEPRERSENKSKQMDGQKQNLEGAEAVNEDDDPMRGSLPQTSEEASRRVASSDSCNKQPGQLIDKRLKQMASSDQPVQTPRADTDLDEHKSENKDKITARIRKQKKNTQLEFGSKRRKVPEPTNTTPPATQGTDNTLFVEAAAEFKEELERREQKKSDEAPSHQTLKNAGDVRIFKGTGEKGTGEHSKSAQERRRKLQQQRKAKKYQARNEMRNLSNQTEPSKSQDQKNNFASSAGGFPARSAENESSKSDSDGGNLVNVEAANKLRLENDAKNRELEKQVLDYQNEVADIKKELEKIKSHMEVVKSKNTDLMENNLALKTEKSTYEEAAKELQLEIDEKNRQLKEVAEDCKTKAVGLEGGLKKMKPNMNLIELQNTNLRKKLDEEATNKAVATKKSLEVAEAEKKLAEAKSEIKKLEEDILANREAAIEVGKKLEEKAEKALEVAKAVKKRLVKANKELETANSVNKELEKEKSAIKEAAEKLLVAEKGKNQELEQKVLDYQKKESENIDLRKKLEEKAKQALEEAAAVNQQLVEANNKLKEENSAIKEAAEKTKDAENQALREEVEHCKTKVKRLNELLEESDETFKEKEKSIEEILANEQNAKDELAVAQSEINKLNELLNNMTNEAELRDNELKEMLKSEDAATNNLMKANSENQQLAKTNGELIAENLTNKETIKKLNAENQDLKKEVQDCQMKVDALKAKNVELETNIPQLLKENKELGTNNAYLGAENEQLKLKNAALKDEKESLQTKCEGYERDSMNVDSENAISNKVTETTEGISTQVDERMLSGEEVDHPSLAMELGSQNLRNMDPGADISGLNEKVKNLTKENEALLDVQKHLEKKINDLESEFVTLDEKSKLLQMSSSKNVTELQKELQEYKDKNVGLQVAYKAVNAVMAEQAKKLIDAKRELKDSQQVTNFLQVPQETKCQDVIDNEKDVPWSKRSFFTKNELVRVVAKKERYKERYRELYGAVLWAEWMREWDKDPNRNPNEKSSIWKYYKRIHLPHRRNSSPKDKEIVREIKNCVDKCIDRKYPGNQSRIGFIRDKMTSDDESFKSNRTDGNEAENTSEVENSDEGDTIDEKTETEADLEEHESNDEIAASESDEESGEEFDEEPDEEFDEEPDEEFDEESEEEFDEESEEESETESGGAQAGESSGTDESEEATKMEWLADTSQK